MSRPLLLGHRGSKSIPENTFASFDRALADGCDGFEFDVRLSADGQAVVCHDPAVGRVRIDAAPAQQLPALPRLHDVLAHYPQAFLDIELKVPGLEEIVIEAIRDSLPQRFVVSSFLPEVLRDVAKLDATVPLGLICESRIQLQVWNRLPVEFVAVHRRLASQRTIRELHAAGKKVLVWTVNGIAEMRQFADWGIDGIISDNTRLLGRLKTARS